MSNKLHNCHGYQSKGKEKITQISVYIEFSFSGDIWWAPYEKLMYGLRRVL